MNLMDGQNEIKKRRELVQFGRALHRNGFVAGTDGNISVRLDAKRIMITPSGMSKARMKPEDMVIVSIEGKKLSGHRHASSEAAMHLTIYAHCCEANAVVHAHPCTATAFASSGSALDQPLCSELLITLGKVPLAPYATPGTSELSESLLPLIQEHRAILMSNHGVVTYDTTLLKAYLNMESVEHFAKIVLATKQLGRSNVLSAENVQHLHEARKKYALVTSESECTGTG